MKHRNLSFQCLRSSPTRFLVLKSCILTTCTSHIAEDHMHMDIITCNINIYLDYIMVEKFRNPLSKLRMSSYRLAVEVGRWHKPQSISFDERKCVNCGVVEDEFHFILQCYLYIDIKKKYLNKCFWHDLTFLNL